MFVLFTLADKLRFGLISYLCLKLSLLYLINLFYKQSLVQDP